MGTSKTYKAPSTPQWADLKGDVTRFSKEGRPNSDISHNIIKKYISSNGGASNISKGNGMVSGRSAVNIARNIGHFVSLVDQYGIRETFKLLDLGSLEGKDIFQVTNKLVDYFSDSSSTIDDVDARNALTSLLDDIIYESVEGKEDEELTNIFDKNFTNEDLKAHFAKFFSYYLYEQFCRVFYERLVTRVGEDKASSFLSGIKDYLISQVNLVQIDKDLTDVEWGGQEGQNFASEILEETLYVFGGE